MRPPSWLWIVALLLILTTAGAVRCYRTEYPVLSADEAFSWRLTQFDTADLIRHAVADVHPPLYYLLLKLWNACAGEAPHQMRGFSALCGVLSVGMMFLLCLEMSSDAWAPRQRPPGQAIGAALFAAFLTAVHLSQVTPGRTARMYPLGVLLLGLTSWLLLRALRSPRGHAWWSLYGVAVAAFC
jgi:uncharacterized membrane protein